MPGPSNSRKKSRKSTGKSKVQKQLQPLALDKLSAAVDLPPESSYVQTQVQPPGLLSPNKPSILVSYQPEDVYAPEIYRNDMEFLPQKPFIHDPGNGPRVRDTRAFLASTFFSQPPAWNDPMCAEFAQPEILQMLMTVLPEETALILWYNKSRLTSRICPACQRLYHLGDILPDHIALPEERKSMNHPVEELTREQHLSGLCSPVCFVLASFNHPEVIKSVWGRQAEDISEDAWLLLNSEHYNSTKLSDVLFMLVRMTRLDDLGLAQLCFPEEEDC